MARTKVARARLTPEEYTEHVELRAREAGVSESEYLRTLIIGQPAEVADLKRRVDNIARRVENIESYLAENWAREVQ